MPALTALCGHDWLVHLLLLIQLSDTTLRRAGGAQLQERLLTAQQNRPLVFVSKYPDARPLFHSDRGFQYTSKQFKDKLDKAGMTQSMSRVGCCIDNGPMESFWGIIKCEMYYLNKFNDYDSLASAIERYIHFYNYERRQKKLDKMPPMTYRQLLESAA